MYEDLNTDTLKDRFHPTSTALIVVDVQNDFCDENGACVRAYDADLAQIKTAIAPLGRLVDAARSADILTVYIRSIYDEVYLSDAMRAHWERRGWDRILQSESWGAEFYGGIGPSDSGRDVVVVKHRFSAFHNTDLDLILRSNGIREVVCCGFTTSTCVESTARDAFFHDYHTAIVSDASGEYDLDLHENTLKLIRRSFGATPSAGSLIDYWTRTVAAT